MLARKTKGRPKAAQSKTLKANSTGNAPEAQRTPANWLLNAATYWRDGDTKHARRAALRGIEAMEARDE
jgi:hypothetical protein